MMAIYVFVYFKCYAPFNQQVSKQDWPAAGAILGTIRKLVGLNLTIGLLTVAVALSAGICSVASRLELVLTIVGAQISARLL